MVPSKILSLFFFFQIRWKEIFNIELPRQPQVLHRFRLPWGGFIILKSFSFVLSDYIISLLIFFFFKDFWFYFCWFFSIHLVIFQTGTHLFWGYFLFVSSCIGVLFPCPSFPFPEALVYKSIQLLGWCHCHGVLPHQFTVTTLVYNQHETRAVSASRATLTRF